MDLNIHVFNFWLFFLFLFQIVGSSSLPCFFLSNSAFLAVCLENGFRCTKFDSELFGCLFDGGLFGLDSLDESHSDGW
jgi:hypothetical protein